MSREVYSEYEKILLGTRCNYSSFLFNENPKKAHENACEIMRYGFYLLGWTPQDVSHFVDMKILKTLKMDVVLKYIIFPEELSKRDDLFYLATILYPEEIHFSVGDMIERVFKKVLNKSLYSFPKRYFMGESGYNRLCICFITYIREKGHFKNVREMYEHFSTQEGVRDLQACYLLRPCEELYETPVDLVHDALADEQKDYAAYSYCKFKYLYRKGLKHIS